MSRFVRRTADSFLFRRQMYEKNRADLPDDLFRVLQMVVEKYQYIRSVEISNRNYFLSLSPYKMHC